MRQIDKMCYLSHLDLVRVLDRALRRAKLPVSYSEGFHPHASISFAPPLPLGVEGWREPVVIGLAEQTPAQQFVQQLAPQLPEGFELVEVEMTSRGRRSPLAGLQVATYRAYLAPSTDLVKVEAAVQQLLGSSRLPWERETKSRRREVDLRPGIVSLCLHPAPPPFLEMELRADPDNLVKLDEVLAALADSTENTELCTTRLARADLR
jgi:radical SAM-linked protein